MARAESFPAGPVLVRVAPEILERMKVGDVEPVVILGVQEHDDGTYDMTLKIPDVDPELVNHRKARKRVHSLLEFNSTGMVSVKALREAMGDD